MTKFKRIDVIREIMSEASVGSAVFATTGETGREALTLVPEHLKFFPCVGGMGHASSIAIGFALQSNTRTICLDGDGALLMHLGASTSITSLPNVNFLHVLFDNGCHLSVGGGETTGTHLDYSVLATALKYQQVTRLENLGQIREILKTQELSISMTHFVYVETVPIREKDLPRPKNLSIYLAQFEQLWS